jgi:hypothetical protein
MGTPREPKPAKFFVAILTSAAELMSEIESELGSLFGQIDGRADLVPWSASKYYATEMGEHLERGFLSFASLRSPAELASAKRQTQAIEEQFRRKDGAGRQVNLDPGYLDPFKVVLASTKNAGQRIYLDQGIYAEVTLIYHSGGFHGMPYTYPDYLWTETLAFLTGMRASYLAELRRLDLHE